MPGSAAHAILSLTAGIGTHLRKGNHCGVDRPGRRAAHRIAVCAPDKGGKATVGGADDAITAGQLLYRDGVLFDGAPLTGLGAAGMVRKGREAACIGCHRRSGFGIAEGPLVVRPITAPDLFGSRAAPAGSPRIAHRLGKRRRPSYDAGTRAKALRAGVDSHTCSRKRGRACACCRSRSIPGQPWLRVEGYASAGELLHLLRATPGNPKIR